MPLLLHKTKRLSITLKLRQTAAAFAILALIYTSSGLGILPDSVETAIKDLVEPKEAQATTMTDRPILFLDPADSVPTGWTCISCDIGNPTDHPYTNRFPLASASAGTNGGASTHTPTISGSPVVNASGVNNGKTKGGSSTIVDSGHTHGGTTTVTVGSATNRPQYGSLQMIKVDSAPDDGTGVPQNAIAMFDSNPGGDWVAYSTVNDRIIIASGSAGTNGGSDTHNHSLSTTLTTGVTGTAPNGSGTTVAATAHQHTASGNTGTLSHVPSHASALFYKCTNVSGCAYYDGVIAMFDSTPDSGEWTVLSGSSGDFDNAFIEASTSYSAVGSNGGGKTHTHATTSMTTGGGR